MFVVDSSVGVATDVPLLQGIVRCNRKNKGTIINGRIARNVQMNNSHISITDLRILSRATTGSTLPAHISLQYLLAYVQTQWAPYCFSRPLG